MTGVTGPKRSAARTRQQRAAVLTISLACPALTNPPQREPPDEHQHRRHDGVRDAVRQFQRLQRDRHQDADGHHAAGVSVEGPEGAHSLRWVRAPAGVELTTVARRIAKRVGHFLERRGLLERDAESASLSDLALDKEPMQALLAHAVTCRIAVGPRAGPKVFTPQSLPAGDEPFGTAPGQVGGFSLHAGVAARADER